MFTFNFNLIATNDRQNVTYTFNETCSPSLPWSPREVTCETNYMEVSLDTFWLFYFYDEVASSVNFFFFFFSRCLWGVNSTVHLGQWKMTGMPSNWFVFSSNIALYCAVRCNFFKTLKPLSRHTAPPLQTGRWCFRRGRSSCRPWTSLKLVSRAICLTWRMEGWCFERRMDNLTPSALR